MQITQSSDGIFRKVTNQPFYGVIYLKGIMMLFHLGPKERNTHTHTRHTHTHTHTHIYIYIYIYMSSWDTGKGITDLQDKIINMCEFNFLFRMFLFFLPAPIFVVFLPRFIILVVINSRRHHTFPWFPLSIRPYHPSHAEGPLNYIQCLQNADVKKSLPVSKTLNAHIQEFIGERCLWVRLFFPSNPHHVFLLFFDWSMRWNISGGVLLLEFVKILLE